MDDEWDRASRQELAASRRRFHALVTDWMLHPCEASALLGIDGDWRAAVLDADGEARMRLLSEIDALLPSLIRGRDVAEWIREPNAAFIDGVSPLAAMSQGRYVLRGIRNVLADYASAS